MYVEVLCVFEMLKERVCLTFEMENLEKNAFTFSPSRPRYCTTSPDPSIYVWSLLICLSTSHIPSSISESYVSRSPQAFSLLSISLSLSLEKMSLKKDLHFSLCETAFL